MPQVHLTGTRYRVSREAVADTVQQYTGIGTVEARQIADRVIGGQTASLYVDDFNVVYDLADILTAMGVNAEADEGDY
ncbi:MAG TPA: hypothetical protein VEW03_13335 [Longimicrobiaceae bacterium]|nr:hypothetical protein [Longimicrobiaceae bacterium]